MCSPFTQNNQLNLNPKEYAWEESNGIMLPSKFQANFANAHAVVNVRRSHVNAEFPMRNALCFVMATMIMTLVLVLTDFHDLPIDRCMTYF